MEHRVYAGLLIGDVGNDCGVVYRQDVVSHIVVLSRRPRRTARSLRQTFRVCTHATPSASTSSSLCRQSASASHSSISTSRESLRSTHLLFYVFLGPYVTTCDVYVKQCVLYLCCMQDKFRNMSVPCKNQGKGGRNVLVRTKFNHRRSRWKYQISDRQHAPFRSYNASRRLVSKIEPKLFTF